MINKYNIFTVCNREYSPFLGLFLCSLYDNVDLQPVQNIIVVDFGIESNIKEYLSKTFPKILFIDSNEKVGSNAIHDAGWSKVTYSKVPYLRDSCENTQLPTLMVDVDSVFVGNITQRVQGYSGDFVVCDRDRDGFSKYIGSYFMVLDPQKSTEFLSRWEKETNTGKEKHKESPALSRLVLNNSEYNFIEEPEEIVSNFSFSQALNSSAYIMHLKSDAGLETVQKRLTQAKVQPYINRYYKEIQKCVVS